MGCDQTEKISLLIDGELAPEDARALELHLSTCSECNQVRADFLGLRSQISAYALSGEPAKPRAALAKVLSRSHAKPAQAGWRPRFSGLGDALRFNPQFAAVVAFVLIALAIGTIAFLRYRPQRDLATNNQPASSPGVSRGVSRSSGTPEVSDQLARNSGRKPARVPPRETGPTGRKPNSRIKPARERSAPKPLPQLQNAAPPTYAFLNGTNGASDPASMTEAASHFEQSELLLRAFRNLRPTPGGRTLEIAYERKRAQQLLYRNILLRREADSDGDVQVATLLGSLEPILLDIANLRDKPRSGEVQMIKERVERTSLVPLLQVNSLAVARANE